MNTDIRSLASRSIGISILVLAVMALGAWLFPTKEIKKRKIPAALPAAIIPVSQNVPPNPVVNLRAASRPEPLSEQGVIDLLESYSIPEDPDRPDGVTGSGDETLAKEPDEVVAQVLQIGPSVLKNSLSQRRYLLNLGRVALLHGRKDVAKGYFFESAKLGSAAAKAYLSESVDAPMEVFVLLGEAISGGYKPAVAMKAKFETECVNWLDDKLVHPGDPQKPAGKIGVSDVSLAQLPSEELEYLIKNYGLWSKGHPELPRLAFGIGRAALWKEDFMHAREYLEVAAQFGSPGALAYLAKLPANADKFDQNLVFLRKSVDGGFEPATKWLEDASKYAFDPNTFSGATRVVTALYQRQVPALLSGAIFFDEVDLDGVSKELLVRPMLLEYMAEFSGYLESEEPGFLGGTEVVMGLVKSGKAEKTRQKVEESLNGLFINSKLGGGLLAIQKALTGSWGALGRVMNGQDVDAGLKQRREQVRQMAKQHARFLFTMKKNGNKVPLDTVYGSVVQFIDHYQ